MEIIWALMLQVCSSLGCQDQMVAEFITRDNCHIAQWQHEQIPTDGAWKSVEYKCIPKGSIGA